MPVVFFILSFLFNSYFVALNVFSKADGLYIFCGFKIIWFLLALFFLLNGIFWQHHFWKRLFFKLKQNHFLLLRGILIFVSGICAFFVIFIVFTLHYIFKNGKSDNLYEKTVKIENLKSDVEKDAENVIDRKIIIVLGGGINFDGKLPDAVKTKIEAAANCILMEKNPSFLVIMAGGQLPFTPCDEASVMKEYFESLLIPEFYGTEVILENMSQDTIQNLQNSAKIAAEYFGVSEKDVLQQEIIVITSGSHLARAKLLANRLGYKKIVGIASNTPVFFALNNYGREVCAYFKLFLRIMFTGKPNNK